MGRGSRAGKVAKQPRVIVRTVWKDTERSVKREQLDIIASICGTKREVIGGVISYAIDTNIYDDGATERATSESVHVDSDTTSTTTGVTGSFSAV